MKDFIPSFGASRMRLADRVAPEDPAQPPADDPMADMAAGTGLYGACSIETYRAAGALHAAHRDAGGFLDAVDRFATPDFWRRDGGVMARVYDGTADCDLDSVRVFYHAGHGRTDDEGRFHLPMGPLALGEDACLSSERLRLGTRALRYLFWSTSQSARLRAGHHPARNWGGANHGLRMLFGFDSVCWDSGRYGANFWRHWRMGKSFSQSWLDGGWDIAADQSAVACACGPDPQTALATLFDERRFVETRVAGQYWAWRWIASEPVLQRDPMPLTLPADLSAARLVPVEDDFALADSVLAHLGCDGADFAADGTLSVQRDGARFQRMRDGRVLLALRAVRPGAGPTGTGPTGTGPNTGPKGSLTRRTILARARSALRKHGFLLPGMDLVFDRVALSMSATASPSRPDLAPVEAVDEIIVQFRQAIGAIPVLTPDRCYLRVAMAPDGGVLRIESTLRQVVAPQDARASRRKHTDAATRDIPQVLARHSARLMRDLAARGAAPLGLRVLPGTTEIGYGIRSNTARIMAREGIEIDCMRGFRKRYWIQSDLGD